MTTPREKLKELRDYIQEIDNYNGWQSEARTHAHAEARRLDGEIDQIVAELDDILGEEA